MQADDLNALPVENDGSYDHAVSAMPDLLADDPKDFDLSTGRPITARAGDGKFATKDEPEVKAKEDPKDVAKVDAPAEDDDSDYIELPAEKEGEAPVRHKLDEVVEGWQKSKTLEAELAQAKQAQPAQPLPHEIEQHVVALQQERTKFVDGAKTWLQLNQPRQPNMDLTNPQSPNYNPELFHGQVQEYQRQLANFRAVQQTIDDASQKSKSEQEALRASKIARETAELQKIWPEIVGSQNEKVRVDTAKALFDHYKIDQALLDSDVTLDHRFYALAKDALAYRASQAQKVEAVKAVKAKPRLIQGQARSATQSPKAAKFSESYKSLLTSGSVEDAADALEGLL